MICPFCKIEKWEADPCPQCALSEKQALFKVAEDFRVLGEIPKALEYLEKLLLLEPNHPEGGRQRAALLCRFALERKEETWFKRASDSMTETLEGDWTWEKGHQIRTNLYHGFGKLETLLKIYQELAKDSWRKPVCEESMRGIRLMMDFQRNPPNFSTTLPEEAFSTLAVKNWIPSIAALFCLLASSLGISFSSHSSGEKGNVPLLVFLTIVAAGSSLILLNGLREFFWLKKKPKRQKVD